MFRVGPVRVGLGPVLVLRRARRALLGLHWLNRPPGPHLFSEPGTAQDLVAYNATVTSCEKGCRWVEALLLLREVPLMGGSPGKNVAFSGSKVRGYP